jgi:L-threonylcarbamoyladenylate synthase
VKTEIRAVGADDTDAIAFAARLLGEGALVAFPTETVYGLGADVRLEEAVRRIFEVKGRPPDRALICHVDGPDSARSLVAVWDDRAEALARRFWPGPLTLILPKDARVLDVVSGGGSTVAVRSPAHPVALALIRALGAAIAAPSANRTARISPTRAEHVIADLDGLIPLVLDAGPTSIGLESTVLDLSKRDPAILRQGAIPRADIEACLGAPVASAETKRVPPSGMSIHLFHGELPAHVDRARAAILWIGRARGGAGGAIEMPTSPDAYAQKLYEALREAEARGASAIWVEMPPKERAWTSVSERLRALSD